MTIECTEELFGDDGCLPVWGHVSASGRPYYTFKLTEKDSYIMFAQNQTNPKAPKFILRKVDSEKGKGNANAE